MPCKQTYPDMKKTVDGAPLDLGLTSKVVLLNQCIPLTPIRKAKKGAAPIDSALLHTRCTRCGKVFPTVLRRMHPDRDEVRNVPQCDSCRHRYTRNVEAR